MINIGIVGAENSHTLAIARLINLEAKIPGARVTHLWGERPLYAKQAAVEGGIPHIVSHPQDMIGDVDAVVVDHRHPKYHLPAARLLMEARLPLFIDKPFCYRLAEGRSFLRRARKLGVPITSFSVLPYQRSFKDFGRRLRRIGPISMVVATGTCDIRSRWGGVFFYGIHQVDMVLRLLGYELHSARMVRGRRDIHQASVLFKGGEIACFNLLPDAEFHLSVVGEKGRADQVIGFDDNPYVSGIRAFVKTFKTGHTEETAESILGPVAVLEALEKSISERGQSIPIRKIG